MGDETIMYITADDMRTLSKDFLVTKESIITNAIIHIEKKIIEQANLGKYSLYYPLNDFSTTYPYDEGKVVELLLETNREITDSIFKHFTDNGFVVEQNSKLEPRNRNGYSYSVIQW